MNNIKISTVLDNNVAGPLFEYTDNIREHPVLGLDLCICCCCCCATCCSCSCL